MAWRTGKSTNFNKLVHLNRYYLTTKRFIAALDHINYW